MRKLHRKVKCQQEIGWTDRQSNLVVEVALRLKTTHCETEYLVNLTKPNRSGRTGRDKQE